MCAGPSASLTFSWGDCTFDVSQFLDSSDSTKILNCTEPSIVYDKEPAIFTSKYKTGGTFTGKVRFQLAFPMPILSFLSSVLVLLLYKSCLRLLHRSLTKAFNLGRAGLHVLAAVLNNAQRQILQSSCLLELLPVCTPLLLATL